MSNLKKTAEMAGLTIITTSNGYCVAQKNGKDFSEAMNHDNMEQFLKGCLSIKNWFDNLYNRIVKK